MDPGVGSSRRPLILSARDGALLVGPDNGLLLPAAARLGGIRKGWSIENSDLMLQPTSKTFHGRDIFAPAAAHLAMGVEPDAFGAEVEVGSLVTLAIAPAYQQAGRFEAEVLYADRFGNLQLNLEAKRLHEIGAAPGRLLEVGILGRSFQIPYAESFADVAPGELVATEDSAGYLSLSVNGGSAESVLLQGTGPELPVTVRLREARRAEP